MKVSVLLFNDFETLDVFGPVEILGRLKDYYQVYFYSQMGGLVHNTHGVKICSDSLESISNGTDIFIIPGGFGARIEVGNVPLIQLIKQTAINSQYVLTVCTGSALLAKTGLLDYKRATSNKRALDWVKTQGPLVQWINQARWIVAGKYYTSSGVSAGMDMTLGFLKDIHGAEFARKIAREIEYTWQEDKEKDEFCI